jgi:hypothetical protein
MRLDRLQDLFRLAVADYAGPGLDRIVFERSLP